ncbi:hypothetical protein [Microbacterium trichothecenolyticum]|uniref:Uncharacterized protein n=1 Tax=Microbacterium trichothecenolyticum TaxID=69370 RepID=A0ABU0TVG5_MICTR|nr:hypothetical protein [Microbacterium trichothecenolyticum]MDQ1123656.1 hypothetical protein [Microbacterium trichothecenolyticum]
MTSIMFTGTPIASARRSTFVPSPADVAVRRVRHIVVAAAVVVSAAGVGLVGPLVF